MKKGVIFEPLLLLALLISLTYAFYIFQFSAKPDELKIGELQGDMVRVYGEGERALFFIERSILLARDKAIEELGQNGGIIDDKCKEDKIAIWDKECNVNEIEKNYFVYLNKNLNYYLEKYEEFKIEKDNYEMEIKDKKLIGKSKKSLFFNVYRGDVKAGNYIVKPDFSVDFSYDLGIYKKLHEKALYIMDNCKDENCANEQFNDFNANIEDKGNFFNVNINDNNVIIKFMVRKKGSLF